MCASRPWARSPSTRKASGDNTRWPESARSLGFASVTLIDDDLSRSGSGLVERPGFQKLVASVCSGVTGAVFCIEASRLARNGRDWHHLIDLCALVGCRA
jgi:DNA invertase Pin-like site-specific DNA recombinase